MRLVNLLILIVFISLPGHTKGIRLKDDSSLSVGHFFEWTSVSTNKSIEDIRNDNGLLWRSFKPDVSSVGIIRTPHWFRLTLTNDSEVNDWLFELNNNALRSMEVWLFYEDGRTQSFLLGANYPVGVGRQYWTTSLNFPISLNTGQSVELYIKSEHKGFFEIDSKISHKAKALEVNAYRFGISLFLYGIFMGLIFYHLVMYAGLRDSKYLSYSFFVLSVLWFFLYAEGIVYLLLDSIAEQIVPVTQASVLLMSISSIWFLKKFLYLHHHEKWMNYSAIAVMAVSAIWIVMRAIVEPTLWFSIALVISATANVFLLSIAFFMSIFNRERYAILFLLAWTPWIAAAIYLLLSMVRVVEGDFANKWMVLKVAFAIQALFLAWAMSLRVSRQKQAKQLAQAQSQAKSDLLARVSHEMRTPLNGILGLSEMINDYLDHPRGKELNKTLSDCGHSLLSVINDLLDMSSIDDKSFKLQERPIEVEPFFKSISDLFVPQLKSKSLVYSVSIDETVPKTLIVDDARLRQIMINLMGNSLKFTEQGSVSLEVGWSDSELEISVKDTGRGISREKLKVIFEPFERVVEAESEVKMGTGLGLHITLLLVNKMGGRIDVTSKENRGTCFKVSIPIKLPEEESLIEQEESGESVVHLPALNILLAEDNSVNSIILIGILSKLGHEVTSCINGKEALELYKKSYFEFDAIMMDCEMPVMDGYDAAKQIRAFEEKHALKPLPIIAVTAHVFEEHLSKIRQCGMNAQIDKPFKKENIEDVLASLAYQL